MTPRAAKLLWNTNLAHPTGLALVPTCAFTNRMSLKNNSILTNTSTGALVIQAGSLVENFGTFSNAGTVTLFGTTSTLQNQSIFENSGTLDACGGLLDKDGTIRNSGLLLAQTFIPSISGTGERQLCTSQESLPGLSSTVTPTPPPSVDEKSWRTPPVIEDFEGTLWGGTSLVFGAGTVELSQGKLLLSPEDIYEDLWVPFPYLRIEDDVYVEAEVSLRIGSKCNAGPGLAVGNSRGDYVGVHIYYWCADEFNQGIWVNYITKMGTSTFTQGARSNVDTLLTPAGAPHTLALEVVGGTEYRCYLDGNLIHTFPKTEEIAVDSVGLLMKIEGASIAVRPVVAFDNVVVREKK